LSLAQLRIRRSGPNIEKMTVTAEAMRRHLVERYRALDAQRERDRQALRSRLGPAWSRTAPNRGVTRAILFGSLAAGAFHEQSDVDILVWGVRGAALDDLAAALSSELGRLVHVVPAETAPESLVQVALEEGEELSVA
jgi:predicted nucleotidyltransferase